MNELWEHQTYTINAVKDSIRKGNRRIIIYLPTGGGKTRTTAEIVKSAIGKGNKAGFLVNRKLLTDNFSSLLNEMGISHDIVQGENTSITGSNVQVCTIQTVAKRGFFPADIWLIDEAHFTPGAKDYRNLIFANKDKIILGFTGTPFSRGMAMCHEELDGEPLFQDIVVGATIPDLIAKGVLVDVDIYCPSGPDMAGCKTRKNVFGESEYSHKDAEQRVNKIELIGSIYNHWKNHAFGMKTFGFAHSIAHSKSLAKTFLERGVSADHIDGYMDDEEKTRILNKFKSGETTVLFNAQMLREGIDVPDARCLILAKPTKSLTSFIQMSGRVLRSFPGKDRALILDHSGSAWELGFPTDDLPLELDDGIKKESSTSKREKTKKEEVICPKCQALKKGLICHNCGHEIVINPNVVEKAGELVKLTKTQKLAQDKSLLYAELKQVAIDKNWTDKKLASQFKNITGVWPNQYSNVDPVKPRDETLKLLTHMNIKYAKARRFNHA